MFSDLTPGHKPFASVLSHGIGFNTKNSRCLGWFKQIHLIYG